MQNEGEEHETPTKSAKPEKPAKPPKVRKSENSEEESFFYKTLKSAGEIAAVTTLIVVTATVVSGGLGKIGRLFTGGGESEED